MGGLSQPSLKLSKKKFQLTTFNIVNLHPIQKTPTNFPASMNRIAIKLKPAAERMVKKGHPWIFEGGITKQSTQGAPGDIAIIYESKKNKLLAVGLYDPDSPIRIKVLSHHKPATINEDWFQQKITEAFAIRQPLLQTNTNSYRLINGENDGLPGLIADIYATVVVVKLYSRIWLPYLELLLPILMEISSAKTMILRLSRAMNELLKDSKWSNGMTVFGHLENEVVLFEEHGIKFSANVVHGHKTGYFLDHRPNRKKIGELAKGKKVLDVFSYAGGFSVHALVGGATEVTSLDISAPALEIAKQNADLNSFKGTHKTMVIDAFEGLGELYKQQQTFDVVVIDPPSFAKRDTEVEKAKVSYQRLAVLGVKLVKKGGLLLLASCSSRVDADTFFEVSEHALSQSGRSFQLLEKTFHDIDHPITFPEGAYLKSGYYKIGNGMGV